MNNVSGRTNISEHLAVDTQGVIRWRSNGYAVPADVAKSAWLNGRATPEQVDATKNAWTAQQAVIWAPIHEYVEMLRKRREDSVAVGA
jgi:hypothetical protein